MRILIVSKTGTHPTSMGNMWAVLAQAEALQSLGCDVHFLYVEERPLRKDCCSNIDLIRIETEKFWGDKFHCYTIPLIEKLWFNIQMHLRKIFANDYHPVDESYPHGLTAYVKKLQAQEHFDACIVNYIYLSKLFTKVQFPKTAIHTHDAMAYKELKIKFPCKTMNAYEEAKGLQRAEHLFVLQDDEAVYFKFLSPCSIIYKIYSIYKYRPNSIVGNRNILFLSGNNGYNQNGIRWFINEVFPLIIKQIPDVKLMIGGGICKVMPELKNVNGVELMGYVDSLEDFYNLGDIAINPVYQGTGLKIKTFEALSYDKVTMVHPHSMSGIYKKDFAPLFSSDNPQVWVDFLKKVWGDKSHIVAIKQKNEVYIKEMNKYILSEYKRFLEV